MAYSRTIFIALIFVIAISPSLGRRERDRESYGDGEQSDVENYLRDLCSQTNDTRACWKIIEPQLSRFNDTDPKTVADVILDLAKTRGDEIHQQLNRLYEESRDEKLQEKYLTCSKHYSDAIRNLVVARRDLGSDDYRNIAVQIEDTIEELNGCRLKFDEYSFDPAHVRDLEREFGDYVDIVKVAIISWSWTKISDN